LAGPWLENPTLTLDRIASSLSYILRIGRKLQYVRPRIGFAEDKTRGCTRRVAMRQCKVLRFRRRHPYWLLSWDNNSSAAEYEVQTIMQGAEAWNRRCKRKRVAQRLNLNSLRHGNPFCHTCLV
jgi:hypothetical protein